MPQQGHFKPSFNRSDPFHPITSGAVLLDADAANPTDHHSHVGLSFDMRATLSFLQKLLRIEPAVQFNHFRDKTGPAGLVVGA